MMCPCLIASFLASGLAAPLSEGPTKLAPLDRRAEFVATLEKPITLNESFSGAALNVVLSRLSEKSEVPMVCDVTAFRYIKQDPNFDIHGQVVDLGKSDGVRLRTVLSMLLKQVDAVYLVEHDHLLILPKQSAEQKIWGLNPDERLSLIHLDVTTMPLTEIVDRVARQSGYNILIAPSVKEEAEAKLSVTMYNTPAREAVEILAEMAELEVIMYANVMMITTSERAKAWKEKQKHNDPMPLSPPAIYPTGLPQLR